MKQLELCWYATDEKEVIAYGLVWSNTPVYCAASVAITKDFIIINQSGMRGLIDEQYTALEACLTQLYPNLEVL